jgi:hypothetical protein
MLGLITQRAKRHEFFSAVNYQGVEHILQRALPMELHTHGLRAPRTVQAIPVSRQSTNVLAARD